MVKIRLTSRGVIQEAGDGVVNELGGMQVASSGSLTSTSTLTAAQATGLILISGSAALTTTLPTASLAGGQMVCFRSLSAHAHVLTGSDSGIQSFSRQVFSGTLGAVAGTGGALTFPAAVGASVALMCDGRNWLICGASGTLVLSNP